MSREKHNNTKFEKLLYQSTLMPEFKNDIGHLRAEFNIPPGGFDTSEEYKQWFINNTVSHQTIPEMFRKHPRLIRKYKLPATDYFLRYFHDYVICENKFFTTSSQDNYLCEIDIDLPEKGRITPTETFWNESGQPYVKIFVPDTTSRDNVKDFIDASWTPIKQLLKNRGSVRKQIRKTIHKKRNARICELWGKTREELGRKRGEYKGDVIARIIKDEFGGKTLARSTVETIARTGRKGR